MKLLLFDIDGTLLMTGGAGKIAIERVFDEYFKVQNAWGNLIPDGKTDPLILDEISARVLNRALTPLEHDQLCERYHYHFRTELQKVSNFRVLPGALELISHLSKREDLVMGVATGNYEEAAWLKLEKGNLKPFFEFGGFGSDASDRTALTARAIKRAEHKFRRTFDADKTFVIGDTIFDIRAGKNLGVKTVAVATGHTPKAMLSELRPDWLLDNLQDLNLFLDLLEAAPSKV